MYSQYKWDEFLEVNAKFEKNIMISTISTLNAAKNMPWLPRSIYGTKLKSTFMGISTNTHTQRRVGPWGTANIVLDFESYFDWGHLLTPTTFITAIWRSHTWMNRLTNVVFISLLFRSLAILKGIIERQKISNFQFFGGGGDRTSARLYSTQKYLKNHKLSVKMSLSLLY